MPTSDHMALKNSPIESSSETPSLPVGIWLRIDLAILRYLHGLSMPPLLQKALILFVRIGDGWIWVGIAAWLYAILPWLAFRRTVMECALAISISLLLYWPIKLLTRRNRPYDAHAWVTRKVPPLDKYSFPSGHTMNNLAVGLTLASQMPVLYAPAIGIPLFLGLLRIVFGVHFFTDIAAGALLGIVSHLIAIAALAPLFPAVAASP